MGFGGTPSGTGGMRFSPLQVPATKELIVKYQDEEAKMGYSPLRVTILAGLVAGMGLWLIPLLWLLLNFLLALASGARGAQFGLHLLPLLAHPTFRFWLAFTSAMGVLAALARRWSARTARYWHVDLGRGGPTRLGLDDLASLTAGTVLLAWALGQVGAGQLFYWLCLLAPVPGFLLHALWEGLYSPLVRRLGRVSNTDRLSMVITGLRRDPALSRRCRLLEHTFDPQSGILEVTVEAQEKQAEDYLRATLTYLGIERFGVRTIRIRHQAS